MKTDDLFDLAASLFETPARQPDSAAAVGAVADGPDRPTLVAKGERLTPGPGAAPAIAVTESAEGADIALVAGASVRVRACPDLGRAGGAPGAAAFSLPQPPSVPSFVGGA